MTRTHKLVEIRCPNCNKKFCEASYIEIVVKCNRCGQLTHFVNPVRATSPYDEDFESRN